MSAPIGALVTYLGIGQVQQVLFYDQDIRQHQINLTIELKNFFFHINIYRKAKKY